MFGIGPLRKCGVLFLMLSEGEIVTKVPLRMGLARHGEQGDEEMGRLRVGWWPSSERSLLVFGGV